MPMQTSELHNQWLHVIMSCAKNNADTNGLFETFQSRGRSLMIFMREKGLPAIAEADYISLSEGLGRTVANFVQSAPDRKKAAGAVLWCFIKAAHPDIKNNEIQNKQKTPQDYNRERTFQKNMMGILAGMHLDLYAQDKINALDYLNFRFSAEQYRAVYNQLGNYNLGERGENFENERTQTVKLVHAVIREVQKTTAKDKIVSAKSFLENVAKNADILEGAESHDAYGNVRSIDAQAKADLFKVMKRVKGVFSEECLDYFSGAPAQPYDAKSHLKIVLNKLELAKDYKSKKQILSQPFARINLGFSKEAEASSEQVMRYATYLFEYASFNFDNDTVKPSVLEKLFDKNSQYQNNLVRMGSLFEDYAPQEDIKKIDKKLVSKVADKYANTFSTSSREAEEFNPNFHAEMTEMFGRIVTSYNYKKPEVQALCQTLNQNTDKEMQAMTKAIMSAYTSQSKSKSKAKVR